MTLKQQWLEDGLAPQLKQLIESDVFKRAVEVIKEHTEPNDEFIKLVYRTQPEHAEKVIAATHQVMAGERRVLRMLASLANAKRVENGELPPPFDHYNEQYFEPRQ